MTETLTPDDLVDIVCEIKIERDASYGLKNGTIDMQIDGREKIFWVPKSIVRVNDDGTITMPYWLAYEKGLI